MSISQELLPRTVTVILRAEDPADPDDYNSPTLAEVRRFSTNMSIQHSATPKEILVGGDRQVSDWKAFCNIDADTTSIDGLSQVIDDAGPYAARIYEVVGEPDFQYGLTISQVQLALRLVRG